MKTPVDTDAENVALEAIVRQIRGGNKDAEEQLIRNFSRPLMKLLEHRTGDIQRAEDVHQDTFCIVLDRLRTRGIDDPARIAAFIHRTALNVLLGEYRKESRRQTHADTELIQRQGDSNADQLRELIRRESQTAIRDTVLALNNERDRELMYRFYILQQEKPMICRALSLTSVHFDRVISRARKRFRDLIERRERELARS